MATTLLNMNESSCDCDKISSFKMIPSGENVEVSSLIWTLPWIRAFPTLLHEMFLYPNNQIDADCDCDYKHQLVETAYYSIFNDDNCANESNATIAGTQCNSGSLSLGYGEIIPNVVITYIMNIVDRIAVKDKLLHATNICPLRLRKILDLGSGSGRVLFAASLAHPFREAVGVEIIPSLHQTALDNLEKWKLHDRASCPNRLNDELTFRTKFNFRNDDILNISGYNEGLSDNNSGIADDADVVIVHATLFDSILMDAVNKICSACKSGTHFIMVTKPLRESDQIETVSIEIQQMTWGFATVFLQVRI